MFPILFVKLPVNRNVDQYLDSFISQTDLLVRQVDRRVDLLLFIR